MKRFLVILLLLLSWGIAYSQTIYIDSTRFITGTKHESQTQRAIATADKGMLLVGGCYALTGGIIPYIPVDTFRYNVLIIKIDSDRQVSWVKVYGGSGDDMAVSACEVPGGGYAILATTNSPNGDVTGYRGGGADLWLLRIDNGGNLLWQKTYGSAGDEKPGDIVATTDGFLIGGLTRGLGGDVPANYGSYDWLVIRTDATGNVEWAKNMGGTSDESWHVSMLAVDTCFYLVSSSSSRDFDCADTTWRSGVVTQYEYNILKLSGAGDIIWSKSYGGSEPDVASAALYDASDNSIVVAGISKSHDYMISEPGGMMNTWVIKVNTDGDLLWQRTIVRPSENWTFGICSYNGAGYLLSGFIQPSNTADNADAIFTVIENNGDLVFSKTIGGDKADIGCTVVPCKDGYAAVGYSNSYAFTEGVSSGRESGYQSTFISYFHSAALNVAEPAKEAELTIFPNPSNGKVSVIPASSQGTIYIVNAVGDVVYRQQVNAGSQAVTLDTGGFATGSYVVRWMGADSSVSNGKLIVAQ